MSSLRFTTSWEDPGGARGSELRATWARLNISVGDQVVTQVVSEQSARGLRDDIYVPLYPLAEWIVSNWWALLYEPASPERIARGYERRHNLARANEGFAWPQLEIRPEGQRVLLAWHPSAVPRARTRFVSQGSSYVARDDLEESLRSFVQVVVARLDDEQVRETPLQEDWAAINGADDEERAFCRSAALLGRDPYALSESEARELVDAAQRLPAELLDEFLPTVESAPVAHAAALARLVSTLEKRKVSLARLEAARDAIRRPKTTLPPWEQGYALARQLRTHVEANGAHISDATTLGTMLRLDATSWRSAIVPKRQDLGAATALMVVNALGSPTFATDGGRSSAQTFALCRALGEYLADPNGHAALVTRTHSERQKRSRAFAAELIAPADQLRALVSSPVLSVEDVSDLAAHFGTSEHVVRHQIENHRIARIDPPSPVI